MDPIIVGIVAGVGALVIGAIVGAVIGIRIGVERRRKVAEAAIGSAEEQAKRLVEAGEKQAETLKKEALLEAKEEILRQRNEAERELKERRKEVTRMETRINQKEETLDKKSEALEKKNDLLDKKLHDNDVLREQIQAELAKHQKTLETISGLSAEEAKQELFRRVEAEIKDELGARMIELEEQFKEEADSKAKNIISIAIQRYAADQVSEAAISVVPLPSEEMKGRIIGREGRNIQKLETLTGVELIIDDTPEAITLSGFDPVRREVA